MTRSGGSAMPTAAGIHERSEPPSMYSSAMYLGGCFDNRVMECPGSGGWFGYHDMAGHRTQ